MKNKDKKPRFVDDGHTVYNMDGVGGARHRKDDKDEDARLSRKEKRAAIRAAFATYLPGFLITLASFALVAVLLYFWLC